MTSTKNSPEIKEKVASTLIEIGGSQAVRAAATIPLYTQKLWQVMLHTIYGTSISLSPVLKALPGATTFTLAYSYYALLSNQPKISPYFKKLKAKNFDYSELEVNDGAHIANTLIKSGLLAATTMKTPNKILKLTKFAAIAGGMLFTDIQAEEKNILSAVDTKNLVDNMDLIPPLYETRVKANACVEIHKYERRCIILKNALKSAENLTSEEAEKLKASFGKEEGIQGSFVKILTEIIEDRNYDLTFRDRNTFILAQDKYCNDMKNKIRKKDEDFMNSINKQLKDIENSRARDTALEAKENGQDGGEVVNTEAANTGVSSTAKTTYPYIQCVNYVDDGETGATLYPTTGKVNDVDPTNQETLGS